MSEFTKEELIDLVRDGRPHGNVLGEELFDFVTFTIEQMNRAEKAEAKNERLRKCVEAADAYVEAVVRIEDSPAMQGVYTIAAVHHCPYNGANWSGELAQYRAARAEVDK